MKKAYTSLIKDYQLQLHVILWTSDFKLIYSAKREKTQTRYSIISEIISFPIASPSFMCFYCMYDLAPFNSVPHIVFPILHFYVIAPSKTRPA